MDAVYTHLVRRDDALIQLLAPPFDKSTQYPGYIRGYVPGVRENGGQYTHGAIWTVMAFAALGDARRAWELMTMINPVNHGRTAARRRDVSRRAVRRCRRRLRDGAAHRPRRLDVVHRLGRVDVPARSSSRCSVVELAIDELARHALPAGGVAGFQAALPLSGNPVSHRRLAVARRPIAKPAVWVDGALQADNAIPLVDDRIEHAVEVVVRSSPRTPAKEAAHGPRPGTH